MLCHKKGARTHPLFSCKVIRISNKTSSPNKEDENPCQQWLSHDELFRRKANCSDSPMTLRIKAKKKGKTHWKTEKEQKQTCLSWREWCFTKNIIQIKIRKALTGDLSFLVVVHTSPIVHRAEYLITVLDHSGLEGITNPQGLQEKLGIE